MRFALLSLALLSFEAGAAEYYLNLRGTTGTGDCSSYQNACGAFNAPGLAAAGAGDVIYLCNSREPGQSGISFTKSGALGNPLVLDGACPGHDVQGNAYISTASDATPMTVNGAEHTVVRNLDFARAGGGSCINYNPTNPAVGNKYQNITVTGCTDGITTSGAKVDGFAVTKSAFRGGGNNAIRIALPGEAIAGIEITDNVFEDNTGTSIVIQPVTGAELTADLDDVLIANNRLANNHGGIVATIGDNTDKSYPCANGAGNTISRLRIEHNILVDNYDKADLSGGGASLGGACWSDSAIRGNVIQAGSVLGALIQHSAGIGTIIEDNDISGPAYPGNATDGGGIFIDQGTRNLVVQRNKIHDLPYPPNLADGSNACSGFALCLYRTNAPRVASNIITRVYAGVRVNGSDNGYAGTETQGAVIANNTFHDITSDVVFLRANVARPDAISFVNNTGTKIGGVFFRVQDTGTEQSVVDWNNYSGAAAGYEGQTEGQHSLSVDPLFLGGPNPTTAEGFRPGYGSQLVGAGTPVGVKYDFSGYRFNVPPSIGAFEVPGPSVFQPFQ